MDPALFIGLMSGTSLDGVDGVLARFPGSSASAPTPAAPLQVLAHAHHEMPAGLRDELLALNTPGDNELHRAALAANALVELQAGVVAQLLRESGTAPGAVAAIGSHGQTVRHRPGEFDHTGYTLQLNNGALLAERSGIDVVCDFRSREVAAGGQGAPLASAFHATVFGLPDRPRAVLNLGGIGNLTLLPAQRDAGGSVRGFDSGPGNALLDHWVQRQHGLAFDEDGRWAASGRVDAGLLAALLSEPFLQLPPPKSTGRDLFNPTWLQARLDAGFAQLAAQDVQATLAEFTAQAAAGALRRFGGGQTVGELLVCGGGALNGNLMARLAAALPGVAVRRSDEVGLPALQVEAAAFAWLARAFVQRLPGNRPEVTGAKGPRLLGALYPAH
ncbi:MAG TPA: anhydro-N-acetylmuramic acid kinase [Ideonella sp.]|nr:anhydro-N-acetylmuramic acid kinase [Ideonella sp.]